MFGSKDWHAAEATVVDARVAKVKVYDSGGTDTRYEYVLEVRPVAGEPFRAKVMAPNTSDFLDPKVGAVVKVEVDPKKNDVRFDRSDPARSFKAQEKTKQSAFDAALREPPTS